MPPSSEFSEIEKVLEDEALALRLILDEAGDESLLKPDVTGSRRNPYAELPLLETGLSLKWSLRTDRAQDCRSQGAKMSTLHRGRMPHFAAFTMEPRPTMLNLLAGGSGVVDCVYCLDLTTLQVAVDNVYSRTNQRIRTRDMFRRLVDMRRIRGYDELVATVSVM
ncbi:NgoMIV family type II restriction endonuclease [Promicromonospora sp. NPDC050249]|uniref:NgoMIV family type II restriction endonuclease n=1 Tax=Promicromonospora sp. NPDC050249 TaxID=3154743 RepID=UPI0033D9CD7F